MQLNPAMVLRSHIRASARPEEIIADQRTVSSSFNRWIRSLVESFSAFASLFRVGSDMNRLIIFWVLVNVEGGVSMNGGF